MSFERYPRILNNKRTEDKPSFTFSLVLLLLGFILTIISLNIYNPNLVPSKLRLLSLTKKTNIAILGCDEIFPDTANGKLLWKGRSDAIVIVHCNPVKNTFNVLNIPRDTKIKIPGHGAEKINYLNTISGPTFTRKYLERLLGIHIDNFVIVNVQGINQVIDELGGIKIDVPQRMEYHDYTAMLHIDLHQGRQTLNGKQVEGFLRFRHDMLGDIGRIQRQQAFMRALSKKLLDPVIFTKLPEIVSIYRKIILTDLKPTEIIKIANFVRNVPLNKHVTVILPGDFGQHNQVSYWIPNKQEIQKLVKKLFYEKEYNQKGFFRFVRVNPKQLKISVFNGSRKDRWLGTKVANILREYGYTVLGPQDSETISKTTKIYAQKANPEVALQLKYDLGNNGDILIENLGPPEADVTILAGDDLTNLKSRLKAKK